jgi:hypothetical protein
VPKRMQYTMRIHVISYNEIQPTWAGLVLLAWDLGVCSSQGLRFDSPWCQFGVLVWLLKKIVIKKFLIVSFFILLFIVHSSLLFLFTSLNFYGIKIF